MKKLRQGEEALAHGLKAMNIPFEREYRFRGLNGKRRWRFDFAILPLELQLAVEVEGGVFMQGRHTRGRGYIEDTIKYNEALLTGWRVLRYTTGQINGIALDQIQALLSPPDMKSYLKINYPQKRLYE